VSRYFLLFSEGLIAAKLLVHREVIWLLLNL